MQRTLQQAFRRGDLTPQSTMDQVKHIGPYLYNRLRRIFASGAQTLTIRSFARRIERLTLDTLRFRLQRALQNRRNNQCVRSNGQALYHVPDYNYKGYEILLALIKVLARNGDGHGLGNRFNFDARQLRMPTRRDPASKTVPCVSNTRSCRRNGGRWSQGLCHPPSATRGFPGVQGYSGQKRSLRSTDTLRGNYVRTPNSQTSWRRPGRMTKL